MTKKILCLGNNTVDTDTKTRDLALESGLTCYGLISELDGALPDSIDNGYYHTSVYDVEYHRLLELAQRFDQVIILDQPSDQYSHPDAFYKTIRLANELNESMTVTFLDPSHATSINYFEELVKTNKSFCIFPFIELLANNGSTSVCCRSSTEITKLKDLKNFSTDPEYQKIRNKMLSGERIPEHCNSCYNLEDQGILSARIQETVEWANRLNLNSLQDLKNIQHPAYYEVRPSNICNLQCRSCGPQYSHLIAREYTKLKLIGQEFSNLEFTNFDFINFTNLKKLYVAGGEPTAMLEFYDFLDRCIENNKVDFELLINTNGIKLSDRFKQQLKHFKLVSFVISIDGYDRVNYYARWPSDWNKIVENMHYLKSQGHSISTNTTVSVYNVLNLYTLLKFFDDKFPGMLVHCGNCESRNDILSGFRFPYPELALERLLPIQQLKCYKNDALLKSFVDGLINHYRSTPEIDLTRLKMFFEFNDKLDQSRNVKLADYVPELEQARKLLD